MQLLRLPPDVLYLISRLVQIPIEDISIVIEVMITSILQNEKSAVNLALWASRFSMTAQEVEDFYALLHSLIKWCLEVKYHTEKDIKNELMEYNFPTEWTSNFFNLVTKYSAVVPVKPNNYSLQMHKFIWRIDISLLNKTIKRAMYPTIIWTVTLSDGEKHVMEINLRKFHEIRFNLSTLLRELSIVKNNNLLKSK